MQEASKKRVLAQKRKSKLFTNRIKNVLTFILLFSFTHRSQVREEGDDALTMMASSSYAEEGSTEEGKGEGKGGENEEERRERKDRERIESAKVGTVSAIGGVLLSLPLALSQFSGNAFNQFADVGATALSCALFGVVYRYAVRENIDDFQLKGGVVGVFGLVLGVGQAEVFMDVASNNDELSFAAFAQAAAICGESVLVFLFAGLCVEAAMTREFILRKSGKE